MLRKYQIVTLFTIFACMLSLFVACSNEDVPVEDLDMAPGPTLNSRFLGDWTCVESENESLIYLGFFFSVEYYQERYGQILVARPNGNSALIHYGGIWREGGNIYTFGGGPKLSIYNLTDDKPQLSYTSDTTYSFTFGRPN